MGKTTARQAIECGVDELMTKNPSLVSFLAELAHELKSGKRYPESYVNVIGQRFMQPFDIYDAYCFASIHKAIDDGRLAVRTIPVKKMPVSDAMEDEINSVLQELPEPFSAKFIGGHSDSDGWLETSQPIFAGTPKGVRLIKAQSYPLEVGYNAFEKTAFYTIFGTQIPGVARWPYGDDKITLLINSGFVESDTDSITKRNLQKGFDAFCESDPFAAWTQELRNQTN